MLDDAERHRLLVAWNQTHTPIDLAETLPQLLADQVQRTPDAAAVLFEDQQLTYAELNRRSDQLASYLLSLGIGPNKLVGVAMQRSLDMVVALAAIMKAGGAYVPLDPAYPPGRLEYMLADSGAKILLTQQYVAQTMGYLEKYARIVCLDSDWPTISACNDITPDQQVQSRDLAYVIYTSGSSGHPKGVKIPQRAVINFLRAMQSEPGITNEDRLLAVTSLSFDISVLEIFLPLITGASVILVDGETVANGRRLIDAIERVQPTIMQATPATWHLLIESEWTGRPDLKLLCGGEELPRSLADDLLSRCGSLWNMYGPTETTVWSAVARVQARRSGCSRGPSHCQHPILHTGSLSTAGSHRRIRRIVHRRCRSGLRLR